MKEPVVSNSTGEDAIRAVNARIDRALRNNRRHEITLVVLLCMLFVVGLSLIVYGALLKEWPVLALGGFVKMTILYPLRLLIRLREANVALLILPQLMKLAKSQDLKELTARLVARLINKV